MNWSFCFSSLRVLATVLLVSSAVPSGHAQSQSASESGTLIRGTVTGHGESMPKAHVTAIAAGRTTLSTVPVADDGSYEITVDTTGIVKLHVNGVHHKARIVPLYLPSPDTLGLDVRLATRSYRDDLSSVAVVGEFNDFRASPSQGIPMEKRSDGTYATTVPAPGDSLAYRLSNVVPSPVGSVSGLQADAYVLQRRGGSPFYASALHAPADSVQVVFDPEKRIVSDAEGSYQFENEDSVQARFARTVTRLEDRAAAHTETMMKAHFGAALKEGNPEEYKAKLKAFDWSPNHEAIKAALSENPPSDLRGALLVAYLANTRSPDSSYAQEALMVVEPSSPAWTYAGAGATMGPGVAVLQALQSSGQPDAYTSYAEEMLRVTPMNDFKPRLLFHLLKRAAKTGDETRQELFYTWLQSEYSDTRLTKRATEYAPSSPLQEGAPVPSFEVSALQSDEKTYTPESFKGRYLLIDFWTPWCAPCYSEIPHLRKAQNRYGDKLTILSVSLAGTLASVKKTVNEYEMPGGHAVAEKGFDSRIAKQFEVVSIPKPILVGPDGTIRVADRARLLGETLLETLDRVIGESDESSPESGR